MMPMRALLSSTTHVRQWLPVPSYFLLRPQLLTRTSPLPVGRDILHSTYFPVIRNHWNGYGPRRHNRPWISHRQLRPAISEAAIDAIGAIADKASTTVSPRQGPNKAMRRKSP